MRQTEGGIQTPTTSPSSYFDKATAGRRPKEPDNLPEFPWQDFFGWRAADRAESIR